MLTLIHYHNLSIKAPIIFNYKAVRVLMLHKTYYGFIQERVTKLLSKCSLLFCYYTLVADIKICHFSQNNTIAAENILLLNSKSVIIAVCNRFISSTSRDTWIVLQHLILADWGVNSTIFKVALKEAFLMIYVRDHQAL